MKKALLFGASGFVGSFLLRELLDNPGYAAVTVVVRKKLGMEHPKLLSLLGDLESLPGLKARLQADDVFIALGTTKKKTPDPAKYYQIDHDYPVLAASMARDAGAGSVFLVSAAGANPASGVFYSRTKGEAERDIVALDFEHTHIFRPSVIMGNRPEERPLERALIAICRLLNPVLFGNLKKYRGIEAGDIAKAMNNAAGRPSAKVTVYEWQDMQALL